MMKLAFVLLVVCYSSYSHATRAHQTHSLPKCPKAKDGGWGDWGRWSPCSVTCGKGHKIRYRYCENPIPKYGGKNCHGVRRQSVKCVFKHCPVSGIPGKWEYTKCSKPCGGGVQHKYRKCLAPKFTSAPCYLDDCNKGPHTVPCNTQDCKKCEHCKYQAEAKAHKLGVSNFVGHACRVSNDVCDGLNGGIKDQYPANHWFFIHCSPDGPWCKPCATRGLVYNAKCGQCERTRYGPCTGDGKWRSPAWKKKQHVEENIFNDYNENLNDEILNDDDMW